MSKQKFKVGDRVKWAGQPHNYFTKGTVAQLTERGPYPYWVLWDGEDDPLLCLEDELEAVNESLDNPA